MRGPLGSGPLNISTNVSLSLYIYLSLSIYIYIHICMCVCVYIYIYIYATFCVRREASGSQLWDLCSLGKSARPYSSNWALTTVLVLSDICIFIFIFIYYSVICYINLICPPFLSLRDCHSLPLSEIDRGLLLAVFAGSEGKFLFVRIGWKGRIWQLWSPLLRFCRVP